ncbi:MAG TPA: lysine 2,3-aminomutase [Bacteroidales bacterium]|nr:lysine 2,3-aminomutase [Bacteroidales bacterium]
MQKDEFYALIAESPENDEPPSRMTLQTKMNKKKPRALVPKAVFSEEKKLPIGEKTLNFKNAHFPEATSEQWNDWHWQLRNSFTTVGKLQSFLKLSDNESNLGVAIQPDSLPIRITPYYASLIDIENANDAIRRTVIPAAGEFMVAPGEASDPLGEEDCSVAPNLVHRYPDRVLFLVTDFCATYCRYCTRSHMVAKSHNLNAGTKIWEKAFEYIRNHPEVRDVLISGGDALTLTDKNLDYLLRNLRAIEHVEMIRIGTKVPVVMPHRITHELVNVLKKYHPLYMSLHFTHPNELTPEVKEACERLANAGIPLGSQTVLLRGINDTVPVMTKLMQGVLKIRVRPYYIYQCDPILGSSHFRTSVNTGLEIIRGMRGFTSGYAIPQFVIDAPNGGGKIPLLPNYVEERKENGDLVLRNYLGNLHTYPDYISE